MPGGCWATEDSEKCGNVQIFQTTTHFIFTILIIIVTFFSVGTLHSPSTHRKGPTPRSIEEAPALDFVISTDIKESKSSEKKTPQRGPDEKVRV